MRTLIAITTKQLYRIDEFNDPPILLDSDRGITLDITFQIPLVELWGEAFQTNSHQVWHSSGSEVKWRWSNVESYEASKFENLPG